MTCLLYSSNNNKNLTSLRTGFFKQALNTSGCLIALTHSTAVEALFRNESNSFWIQTQCLIAIYNRASYKTRMMDIEIFRLDAAENIRKK